MSPKFPSDFEGNTYNNKYTYSPISNAVQWKNYNEAKASEIIKNI